MRSLIGFVCCLFLLSGCDVSVTTASLGEPAISEQVDPTTFAPIEPKETFSTSVKSLNATVKLSNAPSDTTVEARFYLLGENKQEIAVQNTSTSGSRYLNFSLNPPESGWPIGAYQVDFYLDGEMKEHLGFHIQNPQETKNQPSDTNEEAGLANAEQSPGYRAFKDEQFGFTTELPDNWKFNVVGEQHDYLFTGPEGSDEGEIQIVIQIVDTRTVPQSTLESELKNQLAQFTQVNGVKIVKKDETQVGGTTAPFFLATYPSENEQGETISWGHTQLGLENGPIILLVSYAAPRDIYQDKVKLFQHMMDSLELSEPSS